MPAIITDSFDYNDIVRVLDLDEAFVHHQIDALQPKYWRIVIKTKPKGLKIFAPVMVSGNRGIDYMIYMLSRDWQITKKQRLLDYMYFGVYRQTDGFHLVGFMYLDSNPLAKPEKAFFTPHFFDRYKERTGLPMDMPKMDVMKDWIMKNLHLNSDAQGNEKYCLILPKPETIFKSSLISMLLAIVDGGLESLEGSLVNPLQALALIFGNACASHQKPACSHWPH